MEAAARAAAGRTGWVVLLPAAVAVASLFHVQQQADTTATTTTQNDDIKLFFGYKRLCNWATCQELCDLHERTEWWPRSVHRTMDPARRYRTGMARMAFPTEAAPDVFCWSSA
jgi:hypothetical protein